MVVLVLACVVLYVLKCVELCFYSVWYDVHCSVWYLSVSVVCGIMCIVVYDDARIVVWYRV